MTKLYDEAYYDRWYRSRAAPVTAPLLQRKVAHALAAAEFVLGRNVKSVLDVGCGEALWRAELVRMRPGLRYVGVESSDYVLHRFGRARNIRRGSVGTLHELGLKRKFDLIVCADVVYYVPTNDLVRGLTTMRKLLNGVAYVEAYTTADEVYGDMEGWIHRSERTYRSIFSRAGLISCGLNCWVAREQAHLLSALERC